MLNPLKVKKILKKGIPGQARIHAMSTPARGASKFNLSMTLQVFVEGQAPYEVQDQWIVSAKTPLGFGMVLPVKVDPKDPMEVAIDWDAHLEAQRTADAQRRDDLAAQGPVGPGGLGAVPTAGAQVIDTRDNPELRHQILASLGLDPDAVSGDDTISKLERLGKLRASGVLSEAEFQAQKRKLLDS